jgi:hypothetical protein
MMEIQTLTLEVFFKGKGKKSDPGRVLSNPTRHQSVEQVRSLPVYELARRVSTSLIVVKTLQGLTPTVGRVNEVGGFSTSVTRERGFYLAGKKENARPMPKRRISVRPLFAEKRPNMLLPQVNVQLSRTNR